MTQIYTFEICYDIWFGDSSTVSTDRRREVAELPGRRKIGQPHGSFMDVVKEDIKIIGETEE